MNCVLRNTLLPLIATVSLVQGAPAATPADRNDDLDEVIIRGKRAQLDEMRKEIVQLEDRFYSRYNELNTIKDFDVHCDVEARTGTRIEKRSCSAVFEDNALQEAGREGFQIRQRVQEQLMKGVPNPIVPASPPVPPTVKIEQRRPEFRRNMKAVVTRDKNLIRLLSERAELLKRYDELRSSYRR